MNRIPPIALWILFLWMIWPTLLVSAQESGFYREEKNIVIVMDCSGSMNVWDKSGCVPQLLDLWLDLMKEENVNVGFVAYNDTIIANQAITPLTDETGISRMKSDIGQLIYQGETDIGLGLREAYGLLENTEGIGSILLISDGKTDLEDSYSGRTLQDARRDVQEVIEGCQQSEIAITTVAFGEESDRLELREITEKTGGELYHASEAGDLIPVLADFLFGKLSVSLVEIGSATYSAGTQNISYASNACDIVNVLLISDEPVKDVKLTLESGQTIEMANTGNCAVGSTKNMDANLTLCFSTAKRQRVRIFVLEETEIFWDIRWIDKPERKKEVAFEITATDRHGNFLFKEISTEKLQWEAMIVEEGTGNTVSIEMDRNQKALIGTAYFENTGEYLLHFGTAKGLADRYQYSPVMVTNTLPESSLQQGIELFTTSEELSIGLQEYITDRDGDTLTYSLVEFPAHMAEVSLEKNILTIQPLEAGNGEILLLATDGEGSLSIGIQVAIKNPWKTYLPVILGIVLLLLFLLWRFYPQKKKELPMPIRIAEESRGSFTGKLNAYVTRLPEDAKEIPVLTFPLYTLGTKKFVFKDMFLDYPELIEKLELDKLYFFPSSHRELIFYQECNAAIMIGNALICRKIQYVIRYGNIIYITSTDGKFELEVHYIAMI